MISEVLVTGATGFVGTHVVSQLLEKGYRVVAVSRRPPDELSNSRSDNLTWLQCDLNDDRSTTELLSSTALQNVTSVMHLAWQGLPNYKDLVHIDTNLPGSYRFLKRLIESGKKRILVTGTCLEYGMAEGCLHEELTSQPNCAYALAKDSLRRFLELLQQTTPFELTWARLFYMYGQGQNPRSLISLLQSAVERGDAEFPMSGGEQLRDYLPIKQVASYLVRLLETDGSHGIVNICTGKPISVRRLVEEWLVAENKSVRLKLGVYPYPEYEPMAFWGDNRKLTRILGE